MRALRLPIDAVWIALAIALPALAALLAPLSTLDLAYQVRTGDLIAAARALPATDPFTFSAAGAPWLDQQWGSAVVLAAAFTPAGWAGLLVFRAALIAAISGLALAAGRSAGVAWRTAAVLTIVAFLVALPGMGLRAQLLGLLCFAAVLALIGARARHPRLYLAAPLVLLSWANLHGSFPLGLLALAWALLDDAVARRGTSRRDLAVLMVAAVATCITPNGPGVWAYASSLAGSSVVTGLVTEWQPTSIRSVAGAAFAASAAAVGIVAARGRRTIPWPTFLWLGALLLLGAWTERGIVWWAYGAAFAVATILAGAGVGAAATAPATGPAPASTSSPAAPISSPASAPARAASLINGVLALALCAAPVLLAVAVLVRPADPVTGAAPGTLADAPPGVTATLRSVASPGARIFNAQRWGSWLEWAVPQAVVFADSRFEVIPEAAWQDYVAVSAGRFDWARILERHQVDLVVASRADQAGLIAAIQADPAAGWRAIHADDDGVVFAR